MLDALDAFFFPQKYVFKFCGEKGLKKSLITKTQWLGFGFFNTFLKLCTFYNDVWTMGVTLSQVCDKHADFMWGIFEIQSVKVKALTMEQLDMSKITGLSSETLAPKGLIDIL